MDDLVARVLRELPDTSKDRYDIAYQRGRAQARSGLLFGGLAMGALGGAAAMFLLDPARGRGRRAELSQRLTALTNDLSRTAGGRGKDLRNRAQGLAHQLNLPGTPPSNEERRAELTESAAAAGAPYARGMSTRDTAEALRTTDQTVDDQTKQVVVAAGAIRSDEEARGL